MLMALTFEDFKWVISIVILIISSGVISKAIDLKYKKRLSEAQAKKEEKSVDSSDISNIHEIVCLYKTGLEDMKIQKEELERKYTEALSKIQELTSSYENDLNQKTQLINQLTRSQLQFRLELQKLSGLLLSNCDSCTFSSDCLKHKAKLIEFEKYDLNTSKVPDIGLNPKDVIDLTGILNKEK